LNTSEASNIIIGVADEQKFSDPKVWLVEGRRGWVKSIKFN